jgi:ribosome recycling factor
MPIEEVVKDLKVRIEKTLSDFQRDLTKIRTGRANLSLLDGIKVDYYGTPTPLSGVGTLGVPDARLITIKPWDKSVIPHIEKAINEASIGINPSNDGEVVRLPIPALTEERRKEMAKVVKAKGEEHKIAVRNLRRDANERLKGMEKDKAISADDHKRGSERVQKETDAGIAKVEDMVVHKEKEVMEV